MSIVNLYPNFCPECGIGLNNSEKRLGLCYNCKAHWEPDEFNNLEDQDEEEFDENDFIGEE